ncbi:MAG: YjjI family glycine radical enzyme [Gammaproteobacteria bacterium]|nr:MAG: YjjI family glycine radical enzyme [Gammaproteobacteria bacterium]
MNEATDKLLGISTDPRLSCRQKAHYLATAADASLPYFPLSDELRSAMQQGTVCDLHEGHAPYKPRYVLPDYGRFLQQGSAYLELAAPEDFDEALHCLAILYHHVPSVTGMPVFLGQLDKILLPFVKDLSEAQVYRKLRLFWIMLDRTLPDAFVHVNIGPQDNLICRVVLRIDAELQQIVPNLTFMYDPAVTSDELLRVVTANICACSKPHVANYPLHRDAFDEQGFGIVSCYNSLPLAGGANTLVRLNLKNIAAQAAGVDGFLGATLPRCADLVFELIELRTAFLHEQSGFFDSFLVQEGLISEQRFAPMYGVFGMAEAVNILAAKEGRNDRYGHHPWANDLGCRISAALAKIVSARKLQYAWRGAALLHSQAGLSSDEGVTPGVRIPYGEEPDPVEHIKALSRQHRYYPAGVSEILTIDETVKSNTEAMFQLCKGALALGLREFTANVSSNDLVRVTGFMIKLSDIEKFREEGSRKNTTCLGAEAAETVGILQRVPRVISHELVAGER